MKKFLIIIAVVVVIYFAIAGILTATEVCPKYIDLMPRVVGPGVENLKGPNDPNAWNRLFCPFAEKVY